MYDWSTDQANAAPRPQRQHTSEAADFIRAAKELQLEGIIAKRKGSCYVPGRRTAAWVKSKLNQCQEFVIGGYTPGNPFDALIVGITRATSLSSLRR